MMDMTIHMKPKRLIPQVHLPHLFILQLRINSPYNIILIIIIIFPNQCRMVIRDRNPLSDQESTKLRGVSIPLWPST